MIQRTLKNYFEVYKTDTYTSEILYDRNIIIQRGMSDEDLYVEITDRNGNSVNISCYVDINIKTCIVDIKDIVLNYLFDNYLYSHI